MGGSEVEKATSFGTRTKEQKVPIATPEVYAEMLDRAKSRLVRLPGHQHHLQPDRDRGDPRLRRGRFSDGIIQVSTGGAEYASGRTSRTW
jgi:fructose-bisphosphate aldolase class II